MHFAQRVGACVRACGAPILWSALLMPLPGAAQIAPSPSEIVSYRGLYAAAQHGDIAAIEQLASAGAT